MSDELLPIDFLGVGDLLTLQRRVMPSCACVWRVTSCLKRHGGSDMWSFGTYATRVSPCSAWCASLDLRGVRWFPWDQQVRRATAFMDALNRVEA